MELEFTETFEIAKKFSSNNYVSSSVAFFNLAKAHHRPFQYSLGSENFSRTSVIIHHKYHVVSSFFVACLLLINRNQHWASPSQCTNYFAPLLFPPRAQTFLWWFLAYYLNLSHQYFISSRIVGSPGYEYYC